MVNIQKMKKFFNSQEFKTKDSQSSESILLQRVESISNIRNNYKLTCGDQKFYTTLKTRLDWKRTKLPKTTLNYLYI